MINVPKRLLFTTGVSLALGGLAVVPIADSDNGYVAGYIVLPLMVLIGLVCAGLFAVGIGLLMAERNIGLYFLLAMVLLPVGFASSAVLAKYFQIGAYREEPMVPVTPEISNIVLLKEGVTNDQINDFWSGTLGTPRDDGRGDDSLPGIRSVARLESKGEHEVIAFSFFENATEQQRDYVYSQVRASAIVYKLLENVPTAEYMPTPEIPSKDGPPTKTVREINVNRGQ